MTMCRYPEVNIASLRRQVALMAEIRDRVAMEPDVEQGRWMDALVPLTDKLLTELGEAEREACPNARTVWPATEAPDVDLWALVREALP